MSKLAAQVVPASAGDAGVVQIHSPPTGDDGVESRSFCARITRDDPPGLVPALRDLNDLAAIAEEEGDPIPPFALLEIAERQLRRLYELSPVHYMVDSTPESDIVIYACPQLEHSIMLVLYPNGRAFCSAAVPGGVFKKGFDTVEDLTDEALQRAIDLLEQALD